MENPQRGPDPEMVDLPTARHYRELMEQSVSARNRGDHWAAQKLATAAHKWAMEERTRLQRLAYARKSLATAVKRLQAAKEKAPECTTLVELAELHPELKSAVTAWEKAEQLVQELEAPQPDETTAT